MNAVLCCAYHSVVSDSLQLHGLQHSRLPCPSLSLGVCSNLCPLSQWCHPTISSSMVRFFSCPQSFPASESFPLLALCIRWPKYFDSKPQFNTWTSVYSNLFEFWHSALIWGSTQRSMEKIGFRFMTVLSGDWQSITCQDAVLKRNEL